MARFYCCCTNHLGAAKFIGILWGIPSNILLITFLSITLATPNEFSSVPQDTQIGLLKISIGISAGVLLFDIGLIYGSYQKIGCLLTTWAIVTGIHSILVLILAIVLQVAIIIVSGVVGLVINVWAILTVASAVWEIKEEKRNAVVPISVMNKYRV